MEYSGYKIFICGVLFISSGYTIERGKFVDVVFYTELHLYWYRTTSYRFLIMVSPKLFNFAVFICFISN
jgi:hypothetical protein